MPSLTYFKSAVSTWFLHRNPLVRGFYMKWLRPLYLRIQTHREHSQWEKLGLFLLDEGQVTNLISSHLEKKTPFTAAKIGANEFFLLRWWMGEQVVETRLHNLHRHAGLFPDDLSFYRTYGETFASGVKSLDLLGLWMGKDEPSVYQRMALKSAVTPYPNFSGDFNRIASGGGCGWLSLLKGRRVMVISSFAELINSRANKQDWDLYWGSRFPWPSPESITAVPFPYGFEQSTQNLYADSLNLLRIFKETYQSTLENSDLVLLGCGAYAIPLLEWVKKNNKVGVHFGGHIQLLFGIKGGRWDAEAGLYNEHWVRPDSQIIPSNAGKIENGCYW